MFHLPFFKRIQTARIINILRIINLVSLLAFVFGIGLLVYAALSSGRYQFDAKSWLNGIDSTNKQLAPLQGRLLTYPQLDSFSSQHHIQQTDLQPFMQVTSPASEPATCRIILPDPLTLDQQTSLQRLGKRQYGNASDIDSAIQQITSSHFIIAFPTEGLITYSDKTTLMEIAFGLIACIFLSMIAVAIISLLKERTRHLEVVEEKARVQENIAANPDKITPAWDMAELTLEQYYKRNLYQINMIFIVSIFVMLAGFVLISIGIFIAYFHADKNLITIVSTSSGILTEFIGATFIFIYNSTIKQAISYTRSLEKINSVGMSLRILESIDTSTTDKGRLDDAKIEIARVLIQQASASTPAGTIPPDAKPQ